MSKDRQRKDELARKILQCLKDSGVEADLDIGDHEAVVYAQVPTETGVLRIVAHLTDREPKFNAVGSAVQQIAAIHRGSISVRPTLANQAAARTDAPPTAALRERQPRE